MATTISSVPFKDTAEKAAKLDEIIAAHKDQPGALIPILQKAQDVYGYLPIEVQTKIAEGLDISLEKVYEVVTFYAQFSLNPKGEYNFSVCLGTACYVKGAGDLFDKLKQILGIEDGGCTPDGKFSLTSCRCVGACGLAPVLLVNSDVYGRLLPDDVKGIIEKYSA
ncbi:MAG: NAD(P)H-dependent oxidoreductase subunit E [Clostridia bacterium]|nr:NAD(P)H-dependent oxidoreductase subunit E [Oscillospiraceae bacterium]MBO4949852.1 NAD(P)H-dependent oxidoreductase subunit E [Clostridia bacterium]